MKETFSKRCEQLIRRFMKDSMPLARNWDRKELAKERGKNI
jgi:hypothetical protein